MIHNYDEILLGTDSIIFSQTTQLLLESQLKQWPVGLIPEQIHLPKQTVRIINIIGYPYAGKTTFFRTFLNNTRWLNYSTERFRTWEDERIKKHHGMLMYYLYGDLVNEERALRSQLNWSRLDSFNPINPEYYSPLLLERGTIDGLAKLYGYILYKMTLGIDHPEVTDLMIRVNQTSDRHRNRTSTERLFYRTSYLTYKSTQNSEAIILYVNELETAGDRRDAEAKERYGRVVNEQYWPVFDLGYKWLIYNYYPLLYQNYGTGLLVVDGRETSERNYEITKNFIAEITS